MDKCQQVILCKSCEQLFEVIDVIPQYFYSVECYTCRDRRIKEETAEKLERQKRKEESIRNERIIKWFNMLPSKKKDTYFKKHLAKATESL